MGEVCSLRERKSIGITAKRCIAPLLALMVLMGGLLVASQPQFAYADEGRDAAPQTLVVTDSPARSTADSAYDFRMSGNGTNGTSGRLKDNDSSSYVKISSITRSCRMYIDGGHSRTGSWRNCTVNDHANATRVGNWRIMNYVNEWGYGYARLTAWANNGATSVAGVWSSDCAGSYPSINA